METRLQKSLQKCGICFEKVNIQGKLQCCNHSFCFDCIKQWSNRENSCPLCKRRFKTIKKTQNRVNYGKKNKNNQQLFTVGQKNQQKKIEFSFFLQPHLFQFQRILMLDGIIDRMFQISTQLRPLLQEQNLDFDSQNQQNSSNLDQYFNQFF